MMSGSEFRLKRTSPAPARGRRYMVAALVVSLCLLACAGARRVSREAGYAHRHMAAAVGDNLLLNSGFEESDGAGGAAYWIPVEDEARTSSLPRREPPGTRGASGCLLVVAPGDLQKEAGAVQRLARAPLSRDVALQGQVCSSDLDGSACLRVTFTDPSQQVILSESETPAAPDRPGWNTLSARVPVPEGAGGAYVSVVVSGKGSAWFEDVRLLASDSWESSRPPVNPNQQPRFQNGGFECQRYGRLADGWQAPPEVSGLTSGVDSSVQRSGRFSACIRLSGRGLHPASWSQEFLMPNREGQQVTVSAWACTKDGARAALAVKPLDDECRAIAYHWSRERAAELPQWTPLSVTFRVPHGCRSLVVRLLANGGGAVWFDDVSVSIHHPVLPLTE